MINITAQKGVESSIPLRDLPAGAPVSVWSDKSHSWEEPSPFINVDGKTVVLKLRQGKKYSDPLSSNEQVEAV